MKILWVGGGVQVPQHLVYKLRKNGAGGEQADRILITEVKCFQLRKKDDTKTEILIQIFDDCTTNQFLNYFLVGIMLRGVFKLWICCRVHDTNLTFVIRYFKIIVVIIITTDILCVYSP